jgi:hypothetical protein
MMSDACVVLNVGGTVYMTTVSTLTKEESFLSALVTNHHNYHSGNNNESDGKPSNVNDDTFFIDRDGPLFRHILNYLRRGRLIVAFDDGVLVEELLEEATFYQIASLIALLQPGMQRIRPYNDMNNTPTCSSFTHRQAVLSLPTPQTGRRTSLSLWYKWWLCPVVQSSYHWRNTCESVQDVFWIGRSTCWFVE